MAVTGKVTDAVYCDAAAILNRMSRTVKILCTQWSTAATTFSRNPNYTLYFLDKMTVCAVSGTLTLQLEHEGDEARSVSAQHAVS